MFTNRLLTCTPLGFSRFDLMGIRCLEGEGGGGGEGGGEGGQGGESSFKAPATQADLDRIVESRLARERDKFKDYDELKSAKSEYDKLLESQKTEAQKAIDAAKGEGASEVTQKFLAKLVNSEVKTIAASLGFTDPADALQVIGKELPVKDDEPDAAAIKALVEKLATDKPYLLTEAASRKPRTRPKLPEGEKPEKTNEGKGSAAAALRTFAASRKGGSA